MTPHELKSSILQLAIQGKLVEHIKSEKSVAVYSSYGGEIADFFEIPDNWKWLAIKDVATVVTGLSFKKQDQKDASNGTLRVLRGGNIGDDYKYHFYEDDVYVDLEQFQSKYVSLLKGDVITPSVTSMEKICKTGFIDKDLNLVTAGGFVYIIRCLSDDVLDAKYLLYFISSIFNKEQCKPNIHKSGQAFYNLKKSGFVEQPICVPPLAEQKRIVAKIEELLPYIDRYEKAWSKLEDFNKRFPVDMQKSILQMAIQGKLVEQRPEEGSGEELYQQIQAEKQKLIKAGKIKKEKPLPEISDDEIPFDIPESWKWVRFSELMSSMSTGPFGSMLHKSDYVREGVPLVNPANIINEKIVASDKMMVSTETAKRLESYVLRTGMIIMGRRGEMGRCAVVGEQENGWLCGTGSFFMMPISCMFVRYISMLFSTPYAKGYLSVASVGTTMNNLNHKILSSMPVPLPPLAEQKRIVAKLEEILPLCERLK